MNKIAHGIIHGNTIELRDNPGFQDGQEVEVIVKVVKNPRPWGEGLRNSAGALANSWTDQDDKILEEIYQERKRNKG
jgi:hypothetical protein